MIISEECSDTVVDLDMLVGLSTESAVFLEAILESSFCFAYMLFVTAFALNHVNRVFRVIDLQC